MDLRKLFSTKGRTLWLIQARQQSGAIYDMPIIGRLYSEVRNSLRANRSNAFPPTLESFICIVPVFRVYNLWYIAYKYVEVRVDCFFVLSVSL